MLKRVLMDAMIRMLLVFMKKIENLDKFKICVKMFLHIDRMLER